MLLDNDDQNDTQDVVGMRGEKGEEGAPRAGCLGCGGLFGVWGGMGSVGPTINQSIFTPRKNLINFLSQWSSSSTYRKELSFSSSVHGFE